MKGTPYKISHSHLLLGFGNQSVILEGDQQFFMVLFQVIDVTPYVVDEHIIQNPNDKGTLSISSNGSKMKRNLSGTKCSCRDLSNFIEAHLFCL